MPRFPPLVLFLILILLALPGRAAAAVNLTLSKSAPATVAPGGSMIYTIGLGNSGTTVSGTAATVWDQLPAGVVATAVTPGTGVSQVRNCTTVPSAAGALLKCLLTMTAIPASSPNGTRTFTITVTAPSAVGSITNYASVDLDGGNAPPTPGASCTTTSCASADTTVTGPIFTLSKSAPASAYVSSAMTYTLSLGNAGDGTSGTTATVADDLPNNVVATAVTAGTNVSSVSCGALPSAAGAVLTCSVTLTSGLAAGAADGAAAFTITATAPGTVPGGGGNITNYASVDATGGASPPTPGAACLTANCDSAVTKITAINIILSKSAPASATTGTTMSYSIKLGNSGTAQAAGRTLTVADQLPSGVTATAVTKVTANINTVTCTNLNVAGALLTCSATLTANLAAGTALGTVEFTISATAPSTAGSITNYASVDPTSGTSPPTPGAGCAPTNSCGSAATTVTAATGFTLSKTATASVPLAGTITYTLGLGNAGTGTSATSATVKDKLPAGVVATAVTVGTRVSSVNCGSLPSAAGAELSCAVMLSSGLGAGAANGTAAFTITATAPGVGGTITNYASVDPTGGANPAAVPCGTTSCASASTDEATPRNLTLSKSATASVAAGGTITYTLGLGNSGGTASGTAATVADKLPAGVVATAVTAGTGVSSVNCGGLPSAAGATLSCAVTLSAGLAAGAANGAAAFTITATAPGVGGSITNYASVDPTGGASPAALPCATTSCASASTTEATPRNLTLSKSATASVPSAGTITYTLGLGNSGGTTSGTAATVADKLPAGVVATAATAGTGVSAVNCGGLPSAAGATLSCAVTLSAGLAAGAANGAAAFTITATAPEAGGSITNYASVDPTGGASPATPGTSCGTTSCANAATTVATPRNLTLSKTATGSVPSAGTITYTLGLGNSGGTTSGTAATVADQLPVGVVATAATAGAGVSSVNCGALPSAAGAALSCAVTLSAGLAAGAANGAAAFTITATAPEAGGSITNYASVDPTGGASPATPGTSCSTTSCANAATTVATPRNLTLSKTATASVAAGGTITYTLELGNSGGTTSGTAATVKDKLPVGVVATAAAAGTGVSAVNCGGWPSASGAELTCAVTLSAGLAPGAANGTAAFTITATAPATAGTITNYASVDPTGGASPAAPGTSCTTSSCANAATGVAIPATFSLSKSATASVSAGGTITYGLGLGNLGTGATGTSATIQDDLPAGVIATAVTAGTGVASVNCGALPSAAGALLTCSLTLTGGIAGGAANGAAAFTITATAPGTAGSLTNYASVDATGGGAPPAPGVGCTTSNCAGATTTVAGPVNFTLVKSATSSVAAGGVITYALGLGNSGGSPSGTSATVVDQLPAGVVATAVAVRAGVSSVNCGALPSAAGAELTCAVTLSTALASGSANGAAEFTITATAPGTAGSLTNYASVDPSGGASAPAPGASCTTTSCASAVTSVAGPGNFTLAKSATSSASTGGAITYTLELGNSGGSLSGTSATVADQLPAGVVATAVAAGTGVSSVDCGALPSASGAALTCAVTLSAGLAAGAATGAAAFTITASAPGGPGSIVNYASVDSTGGASPATPGTSCGTTSCANASTSVVGRSNITLSKSATSSVAAGGTITYTFGLGNSGDTASGTSVTVADQLPSGVTATSVAAGTGVSSINCGGLPASSGARLTCTLTLAGALSAGATNGTAAFTITATAPTTSGTATNYASVDATGGASPATPGASCGTTSCASASTSVAIPANITLSKTATSTVLTGETVTYTFGLGNSGGTTSGLSVTLADQLPAGVVATAVTTGNGVSSADCGSLPSSPGVLLSCTVTLSRALTAGEANGAAAFALRASAPSVSGSITNYASVDSTGGASPATPGSACTTSSCASAVTTVQNPPDMTIAIARDGGFRQGQIGATYRLTATNSGISATSTSVTVRVTLPIGLTATAMSGTGWSCTLSSLHCTRADSLAGAASYDAVTVTMNVAQNAGSPLSTSVSVSGGGETNILNNSASDSVDVTPAVDYQLMKAHSGSCLPGQPCSYLLTVNNVGAGPGSGTITVSDTLPASVTATAASGTGWTCALGSPVICTRADALASGSSYPVITIATTIGAGVNVALSNTASLASAADFNPNNNSASDTIPAPPDLTVTSSHTTVMQGQSATFTIVASNVGASATAGHVTVEDTLPSGLTPTRVLGIGWVCDTEGQVVTCERGDALAAGAAYHSIEIRVTVSASASGTLTNAVTVSGGGDGNSTNNNATEPVVVIVPGVADLAMSLSHNGTLHQGATGVEFTGLVTNSGSAPTDGSSITVVFTIPEGLRFSSAAGTGWSCGVSGVTVTCSRTTTLDGGAAFPPISIIVDVLRTAPSTVTMRATVSGGGDANPDNNTATDAVPVSAAAEIAIRKSHTGSFVAGQTGAYTLTVSNNGGMPTSGSVVVEDVLPAELRPVSAVGTGWSCSTGANTIMCTRADALASGASYPALTLTVAISAAASGVVTNAASASEGNQRSTASDPVTIERRAVPVLGIEVRADQFFVQGDTAVILVGTANIGNTPTFGDVLVTVNISSGVTPRVASGSGWTFSIDGQRVSAVRSDALAPGETYPPIRLEVLVPTLAPSAATVEATVSGGGTAEPAVAREAFAISVAHADLAINMTHDGAVARGQTDYRFPVTVSNQGPGVAPGPITVEFSTSEGFTLGTADGSGWFCKPAGRSMRCTHSDTFGADTTLPVVTFRVGAMADSPASLVASAHVLSSRDPDESNNTATDSTTVTTFQNVDFQVDKVVDTPVVKIGDAVSFRLIVRNTSQVMLEDVILRDTLPRGFSYVSGTARLTRLTSSATNGDGASGVAGVRSAVSDSGDAVPAAVTANDALSLGVPLDVVSQNGALEFHVGNLPAGGALSVTYAVVVGLDARPGTQVTQLTGSFHSPLGERVVSAPVQVTVTVTASAFASSQVIVGRVFDDVDGDGVFNRGDTGLPGVRIFLPMGQAVTTDENGMYHFPAVVAGTTSLTIDPSTVPAGYGLPQHPRVDEGWSRLLRTPLGAGAILRQNFALVPIGPRTEATSPAPIAPASRPVETTAQTRESPVTLKGHPIIKSLTITVDRPDISAGGRDRTLVTITAIDQNGEAVQDGAVTVQTTSGVWLLPAGKNGDADLVFCRPDAGAAELPDGVLTGTVPIVHGAARLCLQSSPETGTAQLSATSEDEGHIAARASVRFAAGRRSPILAMVGELAYGRGEPATANSDAAGPVRKSGAMFVQTPLFGTQVTFAATSATSVNAGMGLDRRYGLDPNDRVYPVFGDDSTRQEFAMSNAKAYGRIDAGRSSLMFGDLRGDVARPNRSGLLDIARTLTGTELHLERQADQWITLQAARPDTSFAREVLPGTVGSAVLLAHAPILRGSELVTIEVRDRRRPDLVVQRIPMVRAVDYVIDPLAGVIYFERPVPLFADGTNVVEVIVTYEYTASALRTSAYVGRGELGIGRLGLTLGAMASQQDVKGGQLRIGGAEIDQRLPLNGLFHVEAPFSRGPNAEGVAKSGAAVRAILEQPLPFGKGLVRAQYSRTGTAFNNPYGSPVVPGSTIASGSLEVSPRSSMRLRFGATREQTRSSLTDAKRSTASAEWAQRLGDRVRVTSQFDIRRLDNALTEQRVNSQMLTGIVDWQMTSRLQTTVRREQNLRSSDPTYPDQTIVSGRLRLTRDTTMVATQRWSRAPIIPITGAGAGGLMTPLSTNETTIGLESRLRRFTTLTTRYQLDQSINGTDSSAVIGILTRVPVGRALSADWGFERAVPIEGEAGRAYTKGSVGLTFTPENWRGTIQYQHRSGLQARRGLSAGLVGQLRPGLTVLGNYELADHDVSGSAQRHLDAVTALAIRPRATDRAGLLFSWNYGDGMSPVLVVSANPSQRISRVSADGYLQPFRRLELYQRVAWLETRQDNLELKTTTYLSQSRLQFKLFSRLDVAGEVRWVDELRTDAGGRFLGAAEIGLWVSRDLRVGVGYTKQPWLDNGLSLSTNAGRGGVYVVLSSRFATVFDLMRSSRAFR